MVAQPRQVHTCDPSSKDGSNHVVLTVDARSAVAKTQLDSSKKKAKNRSIKDELESERLHQDYSLASDTASLAFALSMDSMHLCTSLDAFNHSTSEEIGHFDTFAYLFVLPEFYYKWKSWWAQREFEQTLRERLRGGTDEEDDRAFIQTLLAQMTDTRVDFTRAVYSLATTALSISYRVLQTAALHVALHALVMVGAIFDMLRAVVSLIKLHNNDSLPTNQKKQQLKAQRMKVLRSMGKVLIVSAILFGGHWLSLAALAVYLIHTAYSHGKARYANSQAKQRLFSSTKGVIPTSVDETPGAQAPGLAKTA